MNPAPRSGSGQSVWPLLLRLAALGAVLAAAAAITFGYLGWLHPAFDSFSHFRIHLAAGLLVLVVPLALLRFLPEAGFAALLGATAIVQTTGLPFGSATGPAQAFTNGVQPVYRLLQLNLRYDNPEPKRTLSLIGEVRPDIVTLNEVSAPWIEELELLKGTYPFRVICPPPSRIGGVAILSRRPFVEGFEPSCSDRGSLAVTEIDTGAGKVAVAALHMGWPWPFAQPWQLPQVEPVLAGLGDTAIVAGDLNAAPWSFTAQRIARASGTRLLRGIGPTWLDFVLPDALRPVIGLPIDNVLVKGGVVPLSVTTLDAVGSDHLPVLFEFAMLPQEAPAPVQQAALTSSD